MPGARAHVLRESRLQDQRRRAFERRQVVEIVVERLAPSGVGLTQSRSNQRCTRPTVRWWVINGSVTCTSNRLAAPGCCSTKPAFRIERIARQAASYTQSASTFTVCPDSVEILKRHQTRARVRSENSTDSRLP